jgi:ubiquinone/menaquinone biosynthesis C-methylase UbiE
LKDNRKFWDKAAKSYDKNEEKDKSVYENLFHTIKNYLNNDDYMLDIGCGTGVLHDKISPHVMSITGIDYSEKMIAIAKEKATQNTLNNVEYLCESLDQITLREKKFNLVTAFYLLHLLPHLEDELKYIHEMLNPNDIFISVTPCLKKSHLLGAFLSFSSSIGLTPELKKYQYEDLVDRMEKTGFKIIEVNPIRKSTHEYLIVARKIN